MAYVDLSRRFRDLTQTELASPEFLASLNELRPGSWGLTEASADGWPELLQYPRVLLLAEAGSGKTVEMRQQVALLMADGKPAFFVALESLYRDPLKELLYPPEELAFEDWKEGRSTAWFFLDAVDELKLTQGTLERALGRLAKEIHGHLHRAHIIISCRPYDWRPSADMATVNTKLPYTPAVEAFHSDEVFLAALSAREGGRRKNEMKVAGTGSLRVVVLLPLSDQQIEILARSFGVIDTNAFIEEIRRREAWSFARRPLDLLELATLWKANGRLGSRAEQHTVNVATKLKDNPDRRDRGLLSNERARDGAERLALALALTRTRTIRSPEQTLSSERTEGVLDPAEILPDWTEEEHQTLLRRALFDPATYGRVRFHHRSVQEYLAARRLLSLHESGMPTKRLRSFLFAERYGERLVIPSMQPITAWLALWNDDVRRELMSREPETLLSMGDPESLSIQERANLLRAFVRLYGDGGWRGFHIPLGEVRRLAHPELADVVRELWATRPASPDVSALLLEIVWQGPIQHCSDIAHSAAFDSGLPDTHRVTAIMALLACGRLEALHEISNSLLQEPEKWPDRVIQAVADDLFPEILSVDDLMMMIERTPEAKSKTSGWPSAIREIVEGIEPLSSHAINLRVVLTDLIWFGRYPEQEWYSLKGRYDHLAPSLASLCDRQLEEMPESIPDPTLIWACTVANRFGHDETGSADAIQRLKKHFKSTLALREAAFWSEMKLISEATNGGGSGDYFRALYGGLVDQLTSSDRKWLLEALTRPEAGSLNRSAAFRALISLWKQNGREEDQFNELQAAVQDSRDMAMLLQQEREAEPSPELKKWQRNERRRALVREGRKRQRVDKWVMWKNELLADPEAAFSPEALATTRRNLYHWLDMKQDSGTSFNVWNEPALRGAFGDEIAERAAKAFKAAWREHIPTLWSSRPIEERNSSLWVWHEGLTGLAAEAMTLGWATRLTSEEARIASVYATIELNGFVSWLPDLTAAHSTVVDAVIGGELTAELVIAVEHSHLPVLQNLGNADDNLKRLLAPRLSSVLHTWPSTIKDEECNRRLAHSLSQVLYILGDVLEVAERSAVAGLCKERYLEEPSGPFSFVWLQSLFRLTLKEATQALEDGLDSISEQERKSYAVRTFADLFGDRNITLEHADNDTRVASLVRLIRCAYRYITPSEDQEHEGAYTPDLRDRAESGRNFLLGALLDTSGAEAQKFIRELVEGSAFAQYRDRLRLLARRRAASDAEGMALKPEDILAIEKQLEAPPHDRDSLFNIMVSRLEDLAHDLAHDDFSDRRTLRGIKEESEMQRTLARRLRDMAKGAYIVSREDEVADQKRTDIRLATVRGEQKAAIEVKMADSWSMADLEGALHDQLLGRYLRHHTCRVGCLLLTYNGTKKHWKHENGRLTFLAMLERLKFLARSIEDEKNDEIRLAVFALDLTDPSVD